MSIGVIILILSFIFFAVAAVAEFFIILFTWKANKEKQQRESEAPKVVDYKAYEISILNELSSKIDYSFDIQDIIYVIIDSLPKFIDYDFVSYILPLPEKLSFRGFLNKSVSYEFISDIKGKMVSYLSSISGRDLSALESDDALRGSIADRESEVPVGAFFHIPLVVSEKVVGLLTISKEDMVPYEERQIAALHKVVQEATGALTNLRNIISAENSKLNAMVASMTDGVIMTDMNYKILAVNPKARIAANLIDKNELSLSDFNASFSGKIDLGDKVAESLKMERVFISEEIQLPTGFFKVVISPVKSRWRPLGCVVVLRDISREKEVQQIKDNFTSMIVHELRSPLDSIKKMIEMMRSTEMSKDQKTECLQMIYGSSSDMLGLVNNLLDMAKIEAGKFDLKKQPSNIKEIIKSRIMFFDIAAKDAKLHLVSQVADNLPEKVDFDPHTVSQVLNNLISNALKFNKEDGKIIIQALVYKPGDNLAENAKDAGIEWLIKKDIFEIPDSLFMAVTNTGQGIAPDQISKLFTNFFQVKSSFSEKGGTGLGLAITKSIIESHGGIVGVESVQGIGATFYFTLPINDSVLE